MKEITIECENRSTTGVADENCIDENVNNFFKIGGAYLGLRNNREER